jgi:small subunit ribosomal protein S6e
MPFKINISNKEGKTFHLEIESEFFVDKSLKDRIKGEEFSPDLQGYEFEITGASDKAGFPALENVEGIGLKKVLLKYGTGMHMRPKGDSKKPNKKPKGLRLRKTVRGKIISQATTQINLKILKEGAKKISDIFPEQNKKEESTQEQKETEKKPSEQSKQE